MAKKSKVPAKAKKVTRGTASPKRKASKAAPVKAKKRAPVKAKKPAPAKAGRAAAAKPQKAAPPAEPKKPETEKRSFWSFLQRKPKAKVDLMKVQTR